MLSVNITNVGGGGDGLAAAVGDDNIASYQNLGYDVGDAPERYTAKLAVDGAAHEPVRSMVAPLHKERRLIPSDGTAGDLFGLAADIAGKYAVVGAPEHSAGAAYIFDTSTGEQLQKLVPADAAEGDYFGYSVSIHGHLAVIGATEAHVGETSDAGAVYVFDLSTGDLVSKLVASDPGVEDDFGVTVGISGNIAIVGAIWADAAYLFDVATGTELSKITASDGSSGDQFGKVAIHGDLAVVGANLADPLGTDSGAAYIYDVSDPTAPVEVAKLLPSDGAARDGFGGRVAIEGDLVAVGAYADDDRGTDSGAVYLFDVSNPSAPVEVSKLTASDGVAGDNFGGKLSISGGLLAVAAPGGDDQEDNAGAAYVFNVSNPWSPVELMKLTASDGAAGDSLGNGIAIDAHNVLAGAYTCDEAGLDSGAAYLFSFGEEKLLPSDGAAGDLFGLAADIAGSYAVVGAPEHGAGAAYVFDTSTGEQLHRLVPADAAAGDYFGYSVSIHDHLAVIGATEVHVGGTNDAGAAYVFDLSTGELVSKLIASDPGVEDDFGVTVGISGNIAIVGAIWADAAYLFDVATGSELGKITASDGSTGDQFGKVAAHGNFAVVGANLADPMGTDSGAAYVYDISDPTAPMEVAKLLPSDGTAGDGFGGRVAIEGSLVAVGAYADDDRGTDAGAVYLFDISNPSAPVELSKLTASDGIAGDNFGGKMSISGDLLAVAAPGVDDQGDNAGAAYVFNVSNPRSPVELMKLTASDGAAGDSLGNGIAIDAHTVLAGAYARDEAGVDSGAAYLFNFAYDEDKSPVIDVGEHILLPDTPGQLLPIRVAGGTPVQGVACNVQVSDGYADVPDSRVDGPNITSVDLVSPGTVFGDVANTGNNFIESREQIWIVGATTSDGVVSADGVLAYATLDTTGWFDGDGPWDFKLAGTFNGDTNFQSPEGQVFPTIINGSIRIDRLPVADPGGPYSVAEGGSIPLDGSGSSDPDSGDVIALYEWDLDGDGIFGETAQAATRGDEVGASPVFSAVGLDGPDTWTVWLEVTDNHGGKSNVDAVEIEIANSAPELEEIQTVPAAILENGIATLTGTIVDPGTPDTFTLQIDWGDDSPAETVDYPAGTTDFSETHQYLDDDPSGTASDEYAITISVVDDDGDQAAEATSVSVSNVAPELGSVPDQTIRRVESLDLQTMGVTFNDVGPLDTHTAAVDWGDGSPPEQAIVVEPTGDTPGEVHSTHLYDRGGFYTVTVTLEDDDTASHSVSFTAYVQAEVVDRHAFYNNSAWDGYDPAAGSADDNATATDKQALLPSETATFANYTSYSRGLNGIMVDVDGLWGTPTAADFVFTLGNNSDPSGWSAAPAPQSITVRPGAGVDGSDRITLIWPDDDPYTSEREPGSISKQWLRGTMLATANTGLAEDDVFYFGNAIGECGNSSVETNVDTNDEIGARNHPHSLFDPAQIDDVYDYDRDSRVDTNDEIIARNSPTSAFTRLQLITAPYGTAEAELRGEGEQVSDLVHVLSTPIGDRAGSWHNATLPSDVNGDGTVSQSDVLLMVDWLNAQGSGTLQTGSANSPEKLPFVDTNGDGVLSPLDALLVVNELNRPAGEAETGATTILHTVADIHARRSMKSHELQPLPHSAGAPSNAARSLIPRPNDGADRTTWHDRNISVPNEESYWTEEKLEDALSDIADDISLAWAL